MQKLYSKLSVCIYLKNKESKLITYYVIPDNENALVTIQTKDKQGTA